jgi:hypothetical protein
MKFYLTALLQNTTNFHLITVVQNTTPFYLVYGGQNANNWELAHRFLPGCLLIFLSRLLSSIII